MEVKCPKCRFRYATEVAPGITEVACVCPRCGTPFTHTITDDDLAPQAPAAQEIGDIENRLERAAAVHPQEEEQYAERPAAGVPMGENAVKGDASSQWIKHTIPAGKPQGRSRRGCLRNCLIVFLLAFIALVFAVRNCFGDRSYKQAMLEEGVKESLNEFGDEAVVRDVDEFVEIHPEPIPDWLEGAWRVETDYGVITITIHGNKIAEESGGEISRGTFYYRQGTLYCDFGDGELAKRHLDMKRKRIDAGEGMLMEKQ
ncbi:MAG: hypothetical protein IKX44_09545 [Prevotella sp.]|nr:hypothetical protein [Prevotella sp.]